MYAASTRTPFTPGYDAGFSPNDQGEYGSPAFYASPAHYQGSPGYGSPNGAPGASPIYTGANICQSPAYTGTSPIYQQPPMSGTMTNQSPQYSPNSLAAHRFPPGSNKPYSPIYNPALNASGQIGKSPAYSPSSNFAKMAAPSPIGNHQSPAYSPSALGKSLLSL